MSYPKSFANHFIGVGGVVIHDNKVLLVQLTYGRAQKRWLIPGGFIEPGETLQEGVVREILEETGLKVQPAGVLGVRSMVRSRDNLTDLYCVIKCKLISSPEPIQPQADEIAKAEWISLETISDSADVPSYTQIIVKKALSSTPMQLDTPLSEENMKRFDLIKYEHFWV